MSVRTRKVETVRTVKPTKGLGVKDAKRPSQLSVFGSGLIALDLIVTAESSSSFRAHAGGTCGNVLTVLAYLGWNSYPIARLGDDAASQVVRADLGRWGVHLDHAGCTPSAHTPIIVQQIRKKRDGTPTHSFSWACPRCGKRLPSFQPVTRTSVERIAPHLRHARVFFMDRLSRGILDMAAQAQSNGALIMYEPSGVAEPRLLKEAVALAHVVKYAEARLTEVESVWSGESATLVEIQTLGERGLRYRHKLSGKRSGWTSLAAIDAPRLVDTCGSGDWLSAGFLAECFRLAPAGLRGMKPAQLTRAFRYGQALAAWNCGFEGARGGMYGSTRGSFERQVEKLLVGGVPALTSPGESTTKAESLGCPACAA
jgi:sugar/nucleoside kinase (ribokinase family)